MRRAAKRDEAEDAIVDAFRLLGWSVERISGKGVPDLLVGRGAHLLLIEVKTGNGKLTADQETWHERWTGPKPLIVRSQGEAIQLHRALTSSGAADSEFLVQADWQGVHTDESVYVAGEPTADGSY